MRGHATLHTTEREEERGRGRGSRAKPGNQLVSNKHSSRVTPFSLAIRCRIRKLVILVSFNMRKCLAFIIAKKPQNILPGKLNCNSIILLYSKSNSDGTSYVDVKLFHSSIGAALPVFTLPRHGAAIGHLKFGVELLGIIDSLVKPHIFLGMLSKSDTQAYATPNKTCYRYFRRL